jgi:3-dehydroquinate dehydratase II
MKLKVINGPNLNLLGLREPAIYGATTYLSLCELIKTWCKEHDLACTLFQSNHEGAIIDEIQDCVHHYDGLIINPGALTHYSYAIRDALAILTIPVIEVHISDIYSREAFRGHNVIKDVVSDSIVGKGIHGYKEAIEVFVKRTINGE